MQARAKQSGNVPAALRNIPKLKEDDKDFLEAYDIVSRSRTWGMAAPNPLSVGEVALFCWTVGIASPAQRAKYLRIVQDLDSCFMEHWAQNNKNKA